MPAMISKLSEIFHLPKRSVHSIILNKQLKLQSSVLMLDCQHHETLLSIYWTNLYFCCFVFVHVFVFVCICLFYVLLELSDYNLVPLSLGSVTKYYDIISILNKVISYECIKN